MTITEYLESKEIPLKELEDNLTFESKKDVDVVFTEGCPNCGDKINCRSLKGLSGSWTSIMNCNKCKRLMFVIFADRMGGSRTDLVYVFKSK